MVQIMENEFDCLADRWGLSGYFSEEFVKKKFLSQVITFFVT